MKPVLLRELMGESLREQRVAQGRTLREVSARARVSLGYLSEVERGQKEASSELLSSICEALGTPMSQVLSLVSDKMATHESQAVETALLTAGEKVTVLPVRPLRTTVAA